MATIRRLSDPDVRSIFECLHHGKPPPPHLKFTIVPVGPTGLKLSPPSFEFEDGLYVLLKPQRKKSLHPDFSKVPSHLMHLVEKKPHPEVCPWSLSGPQFPQPTAIQQRYCYPKGNEDYSSRKGGALWTMHGADGKEDYEFRLLHVYYSAKRSANKGGKKTPLRAGAVSDDSYSPPAAKRPKRGKSKSKTATPHMTPKTNKRGNAIHRGVSAPSTNVSNSPAITTSTTGTSCTSPASLETLPPPSYHFSPPTRFRSTDDMDTDDPPMPPINNHSLIQFTDTDWDDGLSSRNFYPVGPYDIRQTGSFGHPGAPQHANKGTTFSNMSGIHRGPPPLNLGVPQLRQGGPSMAHHPHRHSNPNHQYGNFPPFMHHSQQQLDSIYFDDPLLPLSLTTKPSYDFGIPPLSSEQSSPDVQTFAAHLENLHKQICDKIHTAPSGDQGALLSIFTSWAGHVAKEPMNGSSSSTADAASNEASASASVATATTQNKKKRSNEQMS